MLKDAPTCFSCEKEDQPGARGYRIWKCALQLGDKEHHRKQRITIQQAIDYVKQAEKHLNPGQTPVDAMSAIAKQIQWQSPDTRGEQMFLNLFGGLNAEMTFLNVLRT